MRLLTAGFDVKETFAVSQHVQFVGVRVAKQWHVVKVTCVRDRDLLLKALDQRTGEVLESATARGYLFGHQG